MGNRAVIAPCELQGHPRLTIKAEHEVHATLHVCSAVGHTKEMLLAQRDLNQDRVPVAGHVDQWDRALTRRRVPFFETTVHHRSRVLG